MGNALDKERLSRYLSRRLLPLAASIALLLSLLGPFTYWIIEHRNLHHMTKLYAEELAAKFRDFALESPDLWKYQAYKFTTLIDGFHPAIDVLGFTILDEKGSPITDYEYKRGWKKPGREPTFGEDLNVTLGTAPIIFNNRRVGSVEVLVSDAHLKQACALQFFFSALIGTALAFIVYLFPVRVVRKMEKEIEGLVATLEESRERYRSLVEESLVGVYIIVDGIFRYVNPKMSEIFGWTNEELLDNKGPADLTLPEDWPIVEEILKKRLTGEISSIVYEFRGVTKDKRVIFLEVFGCRTSCQGQTAMIGTLLDISKRKRAEEALKSATEFSQTVMDGIDDSISIVDAGDYSIKGCNTGFLKTFGLTMEDVMGRQCYELTHHRSDPCRPPSHICPMMETIASGKYSVAEHIHVRENGDKFYVEVSTSPVLDGNGMVTRVVYVSRDITERKHAEEKIHRLNEELELKVEERTRQLIGAQEELVRKEKLSILGQLSGSVGHELRNPLGVMSNAVYFLKMVHADGDETTREYLDIIKYEIDNSQRIITDLLDFARTKTPQTTTVSARQLLGEILGKCVIPDSIDLQTELPDSLPLLKIDPLQMGQVFQNLITNAIQAMPNGGSLRVSARWIQGSRFKVQGSEKTMEHGTFNVEPDADFIEISIEDSGEGISEENMEKLFQPLFTTKPKGIGLGLVVCKNLMEANGGRIKVESEPGKGTTFAVVLPVMWKTGEESAPTKTGAQR